MKQKFLTLILVLTVCIGTLSASYTSVGGIYYDFNSSTKTAAVTYRGDSYNHFDNEYSGSVVIPSSVTYNGTTYSVTSIGGYAFYKCSSLTSVTIPNSVTNIEAQAFEGTNIYNDEANWENGVLYINNCLIGVKKSISGAYAINEGTRLIASSAFYGCSSLTSVTVPNSVTSIVSSAFYGCSSLTSVTIPNSVTSIASYAFHGCSSLTSVTIPNSVTSIASYAFSGCSSLTSVTIPNSVTSIESHAFQGCSSLTSITIPNSVTSIGTYAFMYCSSLNSVTIGEGITDIEDDAFYGCSSITSVVWNAKNAGNYTKTSTSLGNGYYSYSCDAPFYDISAQITSFIFGEAVEHIPAHLCEGMPNLTNITLPESVKTIGAYAFYSTGLKTITIPRNVVSIGDYAFRNTSMRMVTCRASTPPTIPSAPDYTSSYSYAGTFERTVSNGTLLPIMFCVIPCGTLDSYSRSNWAGYFKGFTEQSSVYDITLLTNNSYGIAKVASRPDCNSAILTAIPNEGCTFVKWSDGNTQATRYIEVTEDITLTAEFVKKGYTIHVYQDCNTTIE